MFQCEIRFIKMIIKKSGCAIFNKEKGIVTKYYGYYDYMPYKLLQRNNHVSQNTAS